MPTAAINGADLYYEISGAGQPLLFVHGMCGNANVWDDQVRRLSPSFQCVTYDRRGHTRSTLGDVTQRTVEMHADDTAALIEALGLVPCVLVGSSGGARIGLDVVRRYPSLLRGAVLSEPPVLALARDGGREFVDALQPRIVEAMKHRGPRAAVDAFFEFACPGLWNGLDEPRKEVYRANHAELFWDLSMPRYEIVDSDLRAIRVPCLIVWGRDSHPVLRGIAERVASAIPNAQTLEIAHCGHVTYAEQPMEFARGVLNFVDSLSPLR